MKSIERITGAFWNAAPIVAWCILAALAFGCSHRPSKVPDSIPAVGNAVERSTAHVESAQRLNNAAKPLAGSMARPLMAQVSAEHEAALEALRVTERIIVVVGEERDEMEAQLSAKVDRVIELERDPGYRAWKWIKRAWAVLIVLVIFHFVGGAVAPFIPGPFGAALAIGSAFVNPLGWFQTIRDNFYFRRKAK